MESCVTYAELIQALKALKFEELRQESESLFEFVVTRESMDSLCRVLQSYFGPPLKPAGQSPGGKAKQCAGPFGGVRRDQTLYYREADSLFECAMLWPWQSGLLMTVKIVREKREALETSGKKWWWPF